jgi:hypothetical protein
MPLIGPNCYGFLNYLDGAMLWPDQQGDRRVDEGVAIITMSSMLLAEGLGVVATCHATECFDVVFKFSTPQLIAILAEFVLLQEIVRRKSVKFGTDLEHIINFAKLRIFSINPWC